MGGPGSWSEARPQGTTSTPNYFDMKTVEHREKGTWILGGSECTDSCRTERVTQANVKQAESHNVGLCVDCVHPTKILVDALKNPGFVRSI